MSFGESSEVVRMKAWLVTWDWVGKHAEKGDSVVTILNCRFSGETVARCMERLYVDSEFCLSERIEYARNRGSTPYPARFNGFAGQIVCGHNPCLYGRLVDNIHVEIHSDGNEELKYDEIPRLARVKEAEMRLRRRDDGG